jgi:hypothetical protein
VKAPLAVAALLAAALAAAALGVFVAGDAATLVPPPEAVAENFLRALTRKRYAQALSHLTPELRARVGIDGLRRRRQQIEGACGHVEDVRGEEGTRSGQTAVATALVKGAARQRRMHFTLVRRWGEWRLASLGE